jgi:hypothetical protein
MQATSKVLRPAQNEMQQAAHNQDLVEVPKRAQLDRENDGQMLNLTKLALRDEAEK